MDPAHSIVYERESAVEKRPMKSPQINWLCKEMNTAERYLLCERGLHGDMLEPRRMLPMADYL